ncbi:MAG: VCBS repeat-containing protein [Planctomycetota bacterium]
MVFTHGTASSQTQFARLAHSLLPTPGISGAWSIVLLDVDGDGDLDLATEGPRLYRNDGTGAFTDVTTSCIPSGSFAFRLTHGDVDGDGDLDLVGCDFTQKRLLTNNGAGVFTDVTATQMPAGGGSCVALGDVDNDSDLDLVAGGGGGAPAQLFRNDGTGTFTDVTGTHMPGVPVWTLCVTLGDVDGDGWLDIFTGGANRLYRNNGNGVFSDVSATHLPPSNTYQTNSVALGDVDGDLDLDLVCGNGYYPSGDPSRLYVNDGTGVFTDVTTSNLPIGQGNTQSVALGDLDGDGDLDLVLGNLAREVALNDGTGRFFDVTSPGTSVTRLRAG